MLLQQTIIQQHSFAEVITCKRTPISHSMQVLLVARVLVSKVMGAAVVESFRASRIRVAGTSWASKRSSEAHKHYKFAQYIRLLREWEVVVCIAVEAEADDEKCLDWLGIVV